MICVIDYGMGNLRSVSKALEKLGGEVLVSSNPQDIEKADKLVLPGVGAFGHGMEELKKRGLADPLEKALRRNRPFFGICLGMQLLFDESAENPGVRGLGFFSGKVKKFKKSGLKIPHMGWNEMKVVNQTSPILEGLRENEYFYFVHSFYPVPVENSIVYGTSEYGGEKFPAFVGKGSVWASQFHPEKSQEAGLGLLKNFVKI
jgi:glutamine amidotransferase